MSARDELLHERDHLRHTARWTRHQFGMRALFDRNLKPKVPRVLEESIGVKRSNRVRVSSINLRARRQLARLLRLRDATPRDRHLVFTATVGRVVFRHVTNICDVHHMLDAEPMQLQRAAQDVRVQERAEVPDVRVVVHRWSARVERHCSIGRNRREVLNRLRERVVEAHRHGEARE